MFGWSIDAASSDSRRKRSRNARPRRVRGQQLQRDPPLQPQVLGQVDDAHPAEAQQRLDPVAGELGADPRVVAHLHARPRFRRPRATIRLGGGVWNRRYSPVSGTYPVRRASRGRSALSSRRPARRPGPAGTAPTPRASACGSRARMRAGPTTADRCPRRLPRRCRGQQQRCPSGDRSISRRPPSRAQARTDLRRRRDVPEGAAAPETSRPEARPETARTVPSRLNSRSSRPPPVSSSWTSLPGADVPDPHEPRVAADREQPSVGARARRRTLALPRHRRQPVDAASASRTSQTWARGDAAAGHARTRRALPSALKASVARAGTAFTVRSSPPLAPVAASRAAPRPRSCPSSRESSRPG